MRAALPDPSTCYQGPLYRALNPIWARDPLSGEGARRHGGRFNAKGRAALYTAMTIMGAVAEANQIGRPFEPVTLVSYIADLDNIFDSLNPAHLAAHGISAADLAADDWRLQMMARGTSRAQDAAEALIAAGYHGLIAPSFAKGAAPDARNLVLWHWPTLTLIDTEHRLK
ncbi:RES family NAD+ phosphorylase [Cypionkella sinensis]|uniref:RES family NAD+ phosphorylase n=1 Tax=Cypionkella sinensis TaxID=1756043 RepID=A0ABV7IVS2_9RHOB